VSAAPLPIEPGYALSHFSDAEQRLRDRYLQLGSDIREERIRNDPESLVKNSARLLEVVLVAACVQEALHDLDVDRDNLTPEAAERIRERVRFMQGLDPAQVLDEAERHLIHDHRERSGDHSFRLSMEVVLRSVRSLVEVCTVAYLEAVAAELGIEPWGHRCRVAYDALKAFVVRNDPGEQPGLSVLGRKFVEGSLTVSELSAVLRVHPSDAVKLLEDHGFHRSPEQLRLSETDRSGIFEAMRSDRMARGGAPDYRREHVLRDTLASERIEGIDARRWVTTRGT